MKVYRVLAKGGYYHYWGSKHSALRYIAERAKGDFNYEAHKKYQLESFDINQDKNSIINFFNAHCAWVSSMLPKD